MLEPQGLVCGMADDRMLPDGGGMQAGRNASRDGDKGNLSTLNFKVSFDFKREFKGYAVSRGITMVELLKEGFALSKERHGQ